MTFSLETTLICKAQNVKLGEFGVYEVDASSTECKIQTLVEPVNENLALLVVFLILLGLAALFHAFKWAVRKRYTRKIEQLSNSLLRAIGYEVRTLY